MKSIDLECFGTKFKVQLKIAWYVKNGNLYILLNYWEDGCTMPFGVLTVNIGLSCPQDCAFIDVNNFPKEILSWIVSHKLAVPTGRRAISGYCEYPEYRFDARVLQEFDYDGYSAYLQNLNA